MSHPSADYSDHYEQLLAPIYTWMLGGWAEALTAARRTLAQLHVPSTTDGRTAIDLGCGHGAHVVALGELGFATTAVDSSETLLRELCHHSMETTVVCDDIARVVNLMVNRVVGHAGQRFDVVLCLGDTLPYLPSLQAVEQFLSDCAALVAPGGMLALSFRDYTSGNAIGDTAVFFVRGDAHRLMSCCLDYRETTVRVTDIIHEASPGGWLMRAGHCDKLRLEPAHVASCLRRAGLTVEIGRLVNGMVSIVARA